MLLNSGVKRMMHHTRKSCLHTCPMKLCATAMLALAVFIAPVPFGSASSQAAAPTSADVRLPEGMSSSDWQGIVAAYGASQPSILSAGTVSQQAYLKAENTGSNAFFGSIVALSGDTALVTEPGVAVHVFVRSGTNWTVQAQLVSANYASADKFPGAVAIDGDTVVAGAIGEDSNATGVNGNQANNSAADSGAAYVFVRNGTTWSQQAYLKASNTGTNDNFGGAVAIAGDTVVVGAVLEDSSATGANGNQANNSFTNSGAAYVFVRTGTNWAQQAYLKASNTGSNDSFGVSVSLAGDTVVVSATGEDSSAIGLNGDQSNNAATNSGSAYVFLRSGTNWSQQAYLKASNTGTGDFFGVATSLSGDTLVVGASGEASSATGINGTQSDNSAAASGAGYVFVRSGTNWTQQAYLKASNTGAGDTFGGRVALSGDSLVMGAVNEDSSATGIDGNQSDNSANNSGAAYLFLRSGTNWTQQAYLKASNADTNDAFGAVAISGTTILSGAPNEDSSGLSATPDELALDAGAAYVFTISIPAAPVIGPISDRTISEDGTAVVQFVVSDSDTDLNSLTLDANSSSTVLVPNANIALDGTGSNRTATITPAANRSGNARIFITASDGSSTVTNSFLLTVTSVNDAPTLNVLSDLEIPRDASQQTVPLSGITAGGSLESQPLRITASSSNTGLIPNPVVTYTSPQNSGLIRFTPVAGNYGATLITVTVEDGGPDSNLNTVSDNATFSRTFTVTVEPGTNANLSGLALSSGALSPSFSETNVNYSASVSNSVSSITVTPTLADAYAFVTVNDAPVDSGVASGLIPLSVGTNIITVVVTAQDTIASATYTVSVVRQEPPPLQGAIAIEDSIGQPDDHTMAFGDVGIGDEAVQSIIIRNTNATADLTISDIRLTGEGANPQATSRATTAMIGNKVKPGPSPRQLRAAALASSAEREPDSIIVKFKSEANTAKRIRAHAKKGTRVQRSLGLVFAELVELSAGQSVPDMIAAYEADDAVEYAEPNFIYTISTTPNDPAFTNLWGLNNTGQINGGTAGADISALDAWAITTGSKDVIVAVIDTGIDYYHPDLAANMWVNSNPTFGHLYGASFLNGNGQPTSDSPWDDHSHGTHVAGTIGAVGDNGIGIAGVNWSVKLMALKSFNRTKFGSTADAIAAIEYAIEHGAHLSNNSWGGGGYSQALKDAIDAAGRANHLFVAAAGNDGNNNDISPLYPAGYDCPNIISVAASDKMDEYIGFSNYGTNKVHLAAPGVEIYSTVPGVEEYSWNNGTSMATPHVAGVAALLLARHPNAPYADVRRWILNNVDVLPAWTNRVQTGGRLNAAAALMDAQFGVSVSNGWPIVIPPGGSVTIPVRYVPTRETNAFDTIIVSNNDILSPRIEISLSGRGTRTVKLPQSITFAPIANQLITNRLGLAAEASSGLPVAFTVSGPAILSGGTNVTFTGTGVVAVIASQAGNTVYARAPRLTNTFNVLPLPLPVMRIAPLNTQSIALKAGESTNFVLKIINEGEGVLNWSFAAESFDFLDDIEAGTNGWSVYGTNATWHISTNRAYSGSRAWYCGTPGTSTHTSNMVAYAAMPSIHLHTNAPTLRFWHWGNSEEAFPPYGIDGGRVGVIDERGDLHFPDSSTGYTHLYAFDTNVYMFSGYFEWWESVFDLSAFGGQQVKIVFVYLASSTMQMEGWYIDDVAISSRDNGQDWLSINPPSGTVSGLSTTQVSVTVSASAMGAPYNRTAYLTFNGNDPLSPSQTLRIDLAVEQGPAFLDQNTNNVPDSWEQEYFAGLTNHQVTATSDYDQDGLLDREEYVAGTDPLNPSSKFQLGLATNASANAGFRVAWNSVSNRFYSVARAISLSEGFTTLTTGVEATPPVNIYFDANALTNAAQRFYRIGVSVDP